MSSEPITIAGDVSAAYVAFDLRFKQAYADNQATYQRVATRIPSNTRSQNYPIQARIAKLRRWQGERQVQHAKAYGYELTNEKFELTLGIPVEDFEDDQLGVYNATIDDMGRAARLWPDDLVYAAILAGESEAGYDDLAFFSDSHSLGGNTIDNLFASTGLTHDNYAAVREAMQTWVGEDGQSLGVVPNILMVPPALEMQGRQVLMADTLPSTAGTASQSNVMKGTAELIVVPQLSTAAGGNDLHWYMLCANRAVKPFIFQERKAPTFVQKTQMDDETVFWEDEITYGVRARGAAGYGPFWLAAKCKG
jgi:phage major head subunit gpT-like protein